MTFNPTVETIAFRIWAYCQPRGWGDTVPEIADALGLPMTKVRNVVRAKGWNHRLPRLHSDRNPMGIPDARVTLDAALDFMARI